MAQHSRIRIAVVWVMRIGSGNKGMVDSAHTQTNKYISCMGQGVRGVVLRVVVGCVDLVVRF